MDFSTINAALLSTASMKFCESIGVEPTAELAHILTKAVMCALSEWYSENDKEFNLNTNLVEADAVAYAFQKMEAIAALATISAMTGIGMEGLTD